MTLAKRTLQHPGTRPVAWLLLTAMLSLFWGAAPQRAEAQEQEARTAAVLDFTSDLPGGALLGRAAAAEMQLQLTERFYVVRSRAVVIDAISSLGIRAPYEPDEMRLLYKELDARQIFTGRVVGIEEGDQPQPWARVVLRVEVYDGASGDLVNGAIIEEYEQAAPGGRVDRDALRNAAVGRAVNRALTQIEARTLLTATVLQHQPRRNLVTLNRGSRSGVTEGMLFDIFRVVVDPTNPTQPKRIKVGRVKVTDVSGDDSTASVLEAPQGIQSDDVLRQVFVLPEVVTPDGSSQISPPSAAPPRGGSKGLGGMLTGVLGTVAGVGLLFLLLSMQENTNQDSPRVNPNNGAYLRQATPGDNPSVVVTWSDRDFSPPPNYIGGYFVYRGQSENFSATEGEAIGVVPGAAQRAYSDTPTFELVTATIPVRFQFQQGEDVEQVEEELEVEIVHTSPQPGQTYFYKVRRIGPPSVITPPTLITTDSSGSGSGGNFGGNSGNLGGGFNRSRGAIRSRQQWLREKAHGRIQGTGGNIRIRRLGQRRVTRQVTSIPPGANFDTTLDPQTDNDLDLQAEVGISNASAPAGPVTYIVPPEPLAPSDNNQAQRVDEIGFEFQGVLGATEYVLQVSRNVNFTPLVFQSAPISTTSSGRLSFAFNSTQAGFSALAPNTQYFWRVGARSTFRNQPAPQPDGYVFSRVFTFTTADQPPAAP